MIGNAEKLNALQTERSQCALRVATITFELTQERDKEMELLRAEHNATIEEFNLFLKPLWEKHGEKFKNIDEFKKAINEQDKGISLKLAEKKQWAQFAKKLAQLNTSAEKLEEIYNTKIEKATADDVQRMVNIDVELEPLLLQEHPERLVGLINQLCAELPYLDKRLKENQAKWALFNLVLSHLRELPIEVKKELQQSLQTAVDKTTTLINGKAFPLLMIKEELNDFKDLLNQEVTPSGKNSLSQQIQAKEKEQTLLAKNIEKQTAPYQAFQAFLATATQQVATLAEKPAQHVARTIITQKSAMLKRTTAVKSGLADEAKKILANKQLNQSEEDKGFKKKK